MIGLVANGREGIPSSDTRQAWSCCCEAYMKLPESMSRHIRELERASPPPKKVCHQISKGWLADILLSYTMGLKFRILLNPLQQNLFQHRGYQEARVPEIHWIQ